MKIIKKLKGGSLSKTLVIKIDDEYFVRKKISINKNREYGLVRWQSQIRKLQLLKKYLPKNILPISNIGFERDYYYFDSPYLENSDNLYNALKNNVPPTIIAKKIFKILKIMASKKYSPNEGSLYIYILEEIKSPILKAIEVNNSNQLNINIDNQINLKKNLIESLKKIESIANHFKKSKIQETLTHGNLTLENALWNYDKEEIILIDPYYETYCETILGDISQLLQSSASGYEFVSEKKFNKTFDIQKYPINQIPNFLKEFSMQLIKYVKNESWYSNEVVKLMHASQFTRMFPFKLVNNPRQGALFINHGLNLLNEVKC